MADLARLYNFVGGTPAVADQVDAEFDQLIARINDIDADSLIAALAVLLGVSQTGAVRRGKSIIATSEARGNTAYGLLTTPDRVSSVVVPADALVLVGYQAVWQESVAGAARAALFIGTNQLTVAGVNAAGPVTQAAASNSGGAAATDRPLTSIGIGLATHAGGTAYTGDVTTGQALGLSAPGVGGPVWWEHGGVVVSGPATPSFGGGLIEIENLAAGTYDFSVQFKASSGTVTVKNRRLKVVVFGL